MPRTPPATTAPPRPAAAVDVVVAAVADAAQEVTAAELAETTGLGRSTVGKALASLEAHGRVRRTPGGRDGARALPDRWAVTPDADQAATAGSPAQATQPPVATPTGRLRRGELADQVLAYLRDRPGQDQSPTVVAAALGRSGGAVGNALDRLTAAGTLTQTSAKPRRYTYRLIHTGGSS
jgi:DNA-binding transcriptional ArsR family regulator